MPSSFVKKVQQYAFHNGLIKIGDKIVVGFSGGPDSMALICVLDNLKRKQKLELVVVHVNYHQRGIESENDEKFVREFAEKNSLELKVFDYKKGKSKNLEEDMRNFRYAIFEKVKEELKFDKIAVGHTMDDKVETFLMNLMRGAGVEGLISLKNQRKEIVRPLICCRKKEIIEFLKASHQKFCIDKSNSDLSFSRNKIREELIPLLEKEYNQNVRERIFDLTSHLEDDLEIIEDVVKKVYNEKVVSKGKQLTIDSSDLLKMPVALRKRIFRKIIENVIGNIKNISTANFFEFEKILKSDKSKICEMKTRNLSIFKKGNKIYFNKK